MRLAGAILALVLATGAAEARSEKLLAYPREQAWSAAVRFLVVDEHLKVTDKDETAGYVVFELKDEGKTYRGSLELVVVDKDGRKVIRFVAQIEDRPSYLETKMLDRLERKLRVELGTPAPAPKPEKPKDPPKDKGDDKPADKPKPAPPKDSGDDDGPPISPTP